MKKKFPLLSLSPLLLGWILFANGAEANSKLLKGGKNPVPDRYIVKLKDTAAHPRDVARAHGRVPDHVFTHIFRGYAAHIPPHALSRILEDDRVEFVEPDGMAFAIAKPDKPGKPGGGGGVEDTPEPPQVTDWGVSYVGGPVTYAGENKAWVIDSGIDLDHPDLNVVSELSANFVLRGKFQLHDGNGHGTHVAGIIAAVNNDIDTVGVAAGAPVVSVRVLGNSGSGLISWIVAGIDYVAANAQLGDVANLSLGAYGHWETLHQAVIELAEIGVPVVVAAGNDGEDATGEEPAHIDHPNVYTISAIGQNGCLAYWSNYGAPVDYAAPGVNILSLKKGGGVISYNGTSMAAPHVAGILLLGDIYAGELACSDPDGYPDPIATVGAY